MEEFRSCYYPLYNISRRCARFPFLFIHSFAYQNDVHCTIYFWYQLCHTKNLCNATKNEK
jgi:hypothetical protein